MIDFKSIFERAAISLRRHSSFTDADFDLKYGHYKTFEDKTRSDQEIYRLLVMIIFYSGFRASTVEACEHIILKHFPDYNIVSTYTEKEIKAILADQRMIRNQRKIKSCIKNARTFKIIVNEYGSFQAYLASFNAKDSFENLLLLKEEQEFKFQYLGGTTVYHFLTDLGFNVLKPDRVIARIFQRLGLIENEKQLLKAVIIGRKFASATGFPIRYIDVIFVKYGQQGKSEEFGLSNGICLNNNPSCHICGLETFCQYTNR
jgi:DNA-3-methyladenine glycosylase I